MSTNKDIKVGIIELDYHLECLQSSIFLFAKSDVELHVFTKKIFFNELSPICGNINVKWHTPINDNPKVVKNFLVKQKLLLESMDLVLFNTLESKFKFFVKFKLSTKVALRIHNAYTFLDPLGNVEWPTNIFSLYKFISYIFREEILKQRTYWAARFLSEVNYVMFPNTNISKYVYGNILNAVEYRLLSPIPMAYPKNVNTRPKYQSNKALTVVIPGSVDPKRRNYSEIYEAFQILKTRSEKKIKLIFLGRSNLYVANKVRRSFNRICSEKLEVVFFDKRIPMVEYEKYMYLSDVMLNPIKIETNYHVFKEIYGKTKISGAVTDIVRYGKPLILPQAYNIDMDLNNCCLTYTNIDELVCTILKLTNNKILNNLNESVDSYLSKIKKNDYIGTLLNETSLN